MINPPLKYTIEYIYIYIYLTYHSLYIYKESNCRHRTGHTLN